MFIAMLLQTFSMGLIMADFYFHRDRIANELCENKDKPDLRCEGNCQLKKELEKENKKEIPSQFKEILPFVNSEVYAFHPTVTTVKAKHTYPHNDNRIFGYISTIFHPPA